MARCAKARSGFALVIALSLMAFVLLLILSIASFVVVEQQSANIAKQQLVAKQNALVGLQIAIGELQQRLGPDQRATASADILDSSNNFDLSPVDVLVSSYIPMYVWSSLNQYI